ncbi:MAG: LysR family transcriptional regulator [Sphingobium sp.]|uniref:LysR family transcriptional regulator n=1 Tax=Sphingobium sp. TaxID=1912891 RepID=UPI000DB2E197|nr:LysR family transcriptional regulator [Sphingobium sp.]PZU14021.1 MAG: LysR family transcriptional regulator [Sphingobium sp.]
MLQSPDLMLFLAIVREGNMVAAGKRLGIDQSTVARRLTALERDLGARLFDRSSRGVSPTPAAFALLAHAERIESELLAASASVAARDDVVEGVVRLATTEMFGAYLVAPHVEALHRRHPRLTLELATQSRSTSLAKREADIAVMLTLPPRGRLIGRKLTDYRLGLYASLDYLERNGTPASMDDLHRHHFVSYIEELAGFPEMIALDQLLPGASVRFRSTSAAAQQAAVAAGMGIGMLHLFSAEQDERLVRLLPAEVESWRSYWVVMHADLQQLPRIRATIGFLEDAVADTRAGPSGI